MTQLALSVYALASAPPKWERQMPAALLTRPGSVTADRLAAYLHDIPGFRAGRPVIMVGRSENARSQLATVIRSAYIDTIERVRVRGFEVTSEADTIVALARSHMPAEVERIVDEVLVRGSCSVDQLVAAALRQPKAPGRA